MPQKYDILICGSHQPKIHGGGCCLDKGAEHLVAAFQAAVDELDLGHRVRIRSIGCQRNCLNGISVRVLPCKSLYGKVKEADIPELLKSHVIEGKILERLHIPNTSIFKFLP